MFVPAHARIAMGFLLLSICAPLGSQAAESDYFGLLRARDLTSFGFLRLDMRPAHAVTAPKGTWAIETELAYQNTWALSPETEQYLSGFTQRHELGPADLQAIRDLPGENYLVDLELAEFDVTFHYKFADHWGAYLIMRFLKPSILSSGVREITANAVSRAARCTRPLAKLSATNEQAAHPSS